MDKMIINDIEKLITSTKSGKTNWKINTPSSFLSERMDTSMVIQRIKYDILNALINTVSYKYVFEIKKGDQLVYHVTLQSADNGYKTLARLYNTIEDVIDKRASDILNTFTEDL